MSQWHWNKFYPVLKYWNSDAFDNFERENESK